MSQSVAIGITGHRPGKLNRGGLAQIRASLRQTFSHIEARLAPQTMTCVSSIAEGADTMAAEEALDLGWRLVAPLPFPAADYAHDFPKGRKRENFQRLLGAAAEAPVCTPGRATLEDEAEGYRAASHAMLERSRGLVAVWNGETTELIGGAFDTLIEALRRGMPVLWIPSSGAGFPVAFTPTHLDCIANGELPADAGGEDDFLAALGP